MIGKSPEDPGRLNRNRGGKEMNSWRTIAEKLTDEFMAWGCRFNRLQLPEIAMSYDCTSLFFWNWMDGETERSEKGFLRVLGYAWKKYMEEVDKTVPQSAVTRFELAGSDEIAA